MQRAVITGVAGYVPEYILDNAELERLVDTSDEWIVERTGIRERHLQKGEGLGTSDLAVPAVKELLRRTGTAAEEVDLLVCATVTGDFRFPDTATLICHKAGLSNAFGFDLAAACSGFIFALHAASQYVKSGTCKKVIVVGADKMSSIMDYTDRSTCIIFGDGAGAVMLEPSETDAGLHSTVLHADGSGKDELHLLGGGSVNPTTHETVDKGMHYIWQNGRVVFKKAVRSMASAVREVMDKDGLTRERVAWVVPHQANLRIIEAVANALDFPLERVMRTIERYGNTTAATIPLSIRDYERELRVGDHVVLTAFGGGYTWGAMHLVWGYDGSQTDDLTQP